MAQDPAGPARRPTGPGVARRFAAGLQPAPHRQPHAGRPGQHGGQPHRPRIPLRRAQLRGVRRGSLGHAGAGDRRARPPGRGARCRAGGRGGPLRRAAPHRGRAGCPALLAERRGAALRPQRRRHAAGRGCRGRGAETAGPGSRRRRPRLRGGAGDRCRQRRRHRRRHTRHRGLPVRA